jgi:ASC-1-like (ASCH) protein
MHTAGSLKGGQMVWALAKVKESFDLFGGDKVESYLLFSNPHLYGKSIDIRFTPIRVVCNNTLSLSLEQQAERSIKVGHRVEFNANEVKKALGIASDKLKTYKEMAEFLGSKRYNIDSLIILFTQELLISVFKIKVFLWKHFQRMLSHVTMLLSNNPVQSMPKVLGGRLLIQ